ncbi:hypothetical protein GGU45_000398 [Niabella hirudinis]
MLDTGYWVLDAGCRILDAGCCRECLIACSDRYRQEWHTSNYCGLYKPGVRNYRRAAATGSLGRL